MARESAEIWRDADKVVYSTTLEEVSTARTRIERRFDPEAVRRLKEESAADLSIGGGKPALPRGVRIDLELLDHRRFADGALAVRYAVRPAR